MKPIGPDLFSTFYFYFYLAGPGIDEGEMDDEDFSQLWLRYAAEESWGSHYSFFFVCFFGYSLGSCFLCRFRCSWPGDVMVTQPSIFFQRREARHDEVKWRVQSKESEIEFESDSGTRRARTVSA